MFFAGGCEHEEGSPVRPAVRRLDEGGFTTGIGLMAVTIGMVIVALLLVISLHAFGGGSKTGGSSILSNSSAETQLKLCSEGRDSSYGNPPSPAQQAKCLDQLAGQIGGGGASLPGVP